MDLLPRKFTNFLSRRREIPGQTLDWGKVMDATGCLDADHFLGKGNFSEIYRCDFAHMSGSAKIQRLGDVYDDSAEFEAECRILYKAQHPNVVKLLGQSFGPKYSALIYPFVPRGTLEHYLFGLTGDYPSAMEFRYLDWKSRVKIAIGVAEGLLYIHNVMKLLHLDLKLSSILLDQDLAPKIADFGLALEMANLKKGAPNTILRLIKGSPSWTAPETNKFGIVSIKSDVYSFGLVLLHLVTGKKSFDPKWLLSQNLSEVADPKMLDAYSVEGMNGLLRAAFQCTDPVQTNRPEISSVLGLLRTI